jgi:acyl carrier protein
MSVHASLPELGAVMDLVRQVVVDLPPDQRLTANSRFVEDIGMESVNRLMLMTLAEQQFEVPLEDHMAKLIELQTIEELAAFIKTLKTGA